MAFEFFQMAFYDDIFKYFILACNGIALLVWLTTVVTGNYSQMDRLWPILPMVYSWAYLYTSINFTPDKRSHDLNTSIIKTSESRLIIMSCLITAWGLRMAFTFWRRGYYSYGHEDHRWPEVQKRFTSKLSLFLFNFIFMGFVQNWILFGYALPMWFLQTNKTSVSTLNILDYVMIGLYLFGYLIEAIADEQQQLFQTNKYKWLDEQKNKKSNTKFSQQEIEDFKRGFMVRGLFKYSRHPNYFGDILLWWAIYGFTLSSQYDSLKSNFNILSLINYSIFSALYMTYTFTRSVRVTEHISAKKYKQYIHYQSKVGRIIPTFSSYEPLPVKD